jgi:hypothetical protein
MKKIELQQKTTAKKGKIEFYYFENENIGLKKTLFHRIYIPLEPFDSGLEYESQRYSPILGPRSFFSKFILGCIFK